MQPTIARAPFSNPEWLFEPKWDGYRSLCYLKDGSVRFISRNGNNLTTRFPILETIAGQIKADSALIDGEIVALDKDGMPCFDKMRSRKVQECEIVFYAFDLLELNGEDLRQKPLLERKTLLKNVLPRQAAERIRFTDHIIGHGERLFALLEKKGLEGMVAKRIDSVYFGGRTRAWLKIKTSAGREETRKRDEAWKR
jgi:bifunctional non-homologous end joining protein LigD